MSIAPNSRDEITSLSAVAVANAVRSGLLSAAEVAEAYLQRAAEKNPHINAIVAPLYDEARATALKIDAARARGEPLGPLAGVPITIKESFDVLGTPTTLGIAARNPYRATTEGPIVRQLRRRRGNRRQDERAAVHAQFGYRQLRLRPHASSGTRRSRPRRQQRR